MANDFGRQRNYCGQKNQLIDVNTAFPGIFGTRPVKISVCLKGRKEPIGRKFIECPEKARIRTTSKHRNNFGDLGSMNKSILHLCLIGLAAVGLFFGQAAFAVISSSVHDLSGQAFTGEICNVCHTPHNSSSTVAQTTAPLWDRGATLETFTPYPATVNISQTGALAGVSKLCMSCHDGVTNLDAFGFGDTFAGTAGLDLGTVYASTTAVIGIDLRRTHPIGVAYTDSNFATGGLNDPSGAWDGGSVTIDDMLFSTNVECATCHDVHNGTTNSYLLTKSNTTTPSGLCLTCHAK